MKKKILLVIDNNTLKRYEDYYFAQHPKAQKRPIPYPYHESINIWMIMKRPMMNALKQRWKNFVQWLVKEQGYANLRIDECEIYQTVYYATNRRHDVDNSIGKFIYDGLVESGMIVDDSSQHITKITLTCGVDSSNPRTELKIKINKYADEVCNMEIKEEIEYGK